MAIDRLLTTREACERLGCSRSSTYALERRDPSFPRRIRLSTGAVRFSLREIEKWLAQQPRGTGAVRNPDYVALTRAEKEAHRARKRVPSTHAAAPKGKRAPAPRRAEVTGT